MHVLEPQMNTDKNKRLHRFDLLLFLNQCLSVFICGSNTFGIGSGSRGATLDKFFKQKLRQPFRVVTDDSVLLEQIVEQAAHA
jgi:hypothetical protein